MLKGSCINPQILKTLSLCGHGDKVLIADGNYPLTSHISSTASNVFLGLSEGIPSVTQVLKVLSKEISVEEARIMLPDNSVEEPEIYNEFKEILPNTKFEALERYTFYKACCDTQVKMGISTGEKRLYANILITIGTV